VHALRPLIAEITSDYNSIWNPLEIKKNLRKILFKREVKCNKILTNQQTVNRPNDANRDLATRSDCVISREFNELDLDDIELLSIACVLDLA
jgi:hypothetical protein